MLESDADRLALIKGSDGEQFDTGRPERLWGILDRPSYDALGNFIPVKNRRSELLCRESDITAHGLMKQSLLRRVADDSTYAIREFEPDGTGMTLVVLSV